MNVQIGQLPAVITINGSDVIPVETATFTGKVTVNQLGNELVSLITKYRADNVTLGLDEDTNTFYVLASYLPLSGGTMVGSLILSGNPTVPTEASTKEYVDNTANTLRSEGANSFVKKIGDTMSGLLTLSGPPTADLHAVTKAYADNTFTKSVDGPFIKKPSSATPGNILSYSGTDWVASNGNFIPIPTPSSSGQVLTFNGISWVAQTSSSDIPVGAISFFASNAVPAGWLECDGSSKSVTVYVDLFAAIQYTYGGSGSSFNLPNLRGEFLRGWDNGRGVDNGRSFGSWQADELKSHTHGCNGGGGNEGGPFIDSTSQIDYQTVQTLPTGGTETRPRNVAMLACIKAFSASLTQTAIDVGMLASSKVDKADFTGSNQSLGLNGYQKLPGGLILQWGVAVPVLPDADSLVTFPITFPNNIFNVIVTFNYNGSIVSHNEIANTRNLTKSGFVAENQQADSSATPLAGNIYWQAIGN